VRRARRAAIAFQSVFRQCRSSVHPSADPSCRRRLLPPNSVARRLDYRCDRTRKHWRRPEHVTRPPPTRTVPRHRRRPGRAAEHRRRSRSNRRRRPGWPLCSAGSSTSPSAGSTWQRLSVSIL